MQGWSDAGGGGGRYCSASDNNTTNKTRGPGGSIKIPTASQIYFRKQEGGSVYVHCIIIILYTV